ncbi:methyltransferase domain-containing protein [Halococcoides cellulosivorans]|uniref:SAM-dependent methyltransferase n=1 Tax=Halococcoides cellulosivorans TaxID=1679096 RepID=A0A2R4X069_9EURY|nr:methyltransferase domain-containing protein [Halococcoides cellulosivorans]AWB27192.1 SAM-dependent methyltransferase [Halococcoides cellulosivorans]
MALVFVHDDRSYVLEPGERFECDQGVLEVPPDLSPGDTVETHLGTAFRARELRGPDFLEHFERTGAPMLPRDVGLIVGETGVSVSDRVLDAGTGTGILAATLGRAGADVLTFERDADFARVAADNMELADVGDRVSVVAGDVREVLDDEGFDLMTLDMGDAPTMIERAPELLVPGGFLAVYTPFVEHASDVVEAARDAGLNRVSCRETIRRELDVGDRGTRPSTAGVGHTGYLTIARRP